MNCLSCVSPKKSVDYDEEMGSRSSVSPGGRGKTNANIDNVLNSLERGKIKGEDYNSGMNVARSFPFKELEIATQNFGGANLMGKGCFGSVYKGHLDSGLIVAVKQLNLEGIRNQEFVVEVLMLSLLHHPNLVNLIGYCTHDEQKFLVYEFMPMGSLENHLHDLEPGEKPLSWSQRMKIAAGTARGLEYLHMKAKPPVLHRDMKSSNIMLDNDYNVKLSDFGIAKLEPINCNCDQLFMPYGSFGYSAPEYAMSGKLSLKSDIYSFGVVLLELITGRKALDFSRQREEMSVVVWSRPFLQNEKSFLDMVDPRLEGRFPHKRMKQAVAIAQMCIQDYAAIRPSTGDIVEALEYLANKAAESQNQPSTSTSQVPI